MKGVIWAATILAAATSVTASAQEAPSAQTATDTGAQAQDDNKKICHTEKATGSLTRRTRVCLTAAQWREVQTRTYNGVREMQGQGSGGQVVQNNAGAGG
jgi:predicted transglutaminase-like cysteine proteinase